MDIEDIILSRDKRTVGNLRQYLAPHFCEDAARFILERPGPVFIVSGFYILDAKNVETDGPPGAIAIGRALQALGNSVSYVTDSYGAFCFRSEEERGAKVVEFPIMDDEESSAEAKRLLEEDKPSVLITIERPGLTVGGTYRNSAGRDITPYTARLDHLFYNHPASVGIGDGGNEIGMGVLYEVILRIPTLAPFPTATPVTQLIAASVSNWGGYGLVAALSRQTGRDLLPTDEEQAEIIQWEYDRGVWGTGATPDIPGVDNFSIEENLEILRMLRQHVEYGG